MHVVESAGRSYMPSHDHCQSSNAQDIPANYNILLDRPIRECLSTPGTTLQGRSSQA